MKLIQLIKEPFPSKVNQKTYFLEMLGVATFITLFLYLIRPFGIANWEGPLFLHCLGFGIITLTISLLFDAFLTFVLKVRKDLPSWTFGKWILSAAIMLMLLGFANYTYVHYLVYQSLQNWNLQAAFNMVYYTVLLGIFPLIFGGMMQQIRAQKNNEIEASVVQEQITQSHNPSVTPVANIVIPPSSNSPTKDAFSHLVPRVSHQIILNSQNQKDQLQLSLRQILYLEAQQNYVEVCYYEKERQQVQRKLLRNTLSQLEKQLLETNVIRCHRSFLVNLSRIEKVTGNAQGLKLKLEHLPDQIIPVSRKYIAPLKKRLKDK